MRNVQHKKTEGEKLRNHSCGDRKKKEKKEKKKKEKKEKKKKEEEIGAKDEDEGHDC